MQFRSVANIKRNNSMNDSWDLERIAWISSLLVCSLSEQQVVLKLYSLGIGSHDSGFLRQFLGTHELQTWISAQTTEAARDDSRA
jgi:hypothetical protein